MHREPSIVVRAHIPVNSLTSVFGSVGSSWVSLGSGNAVLPGVRRHIDHRLITRVDRSVPRRRGFSAPCTRHAEPDAVLANDKQKENRNGPSGSP